MRSRVRHRSDLKEINAAMKIILSLFCAVCVFWSVFNLLPAAEPANDGSKKADELPAVEPDVIKTIPIIDADALSAPTPFQSHFGSISTDRAAEILDVIASARESGLLGEDETVAFDPSVTFYDGTEIKYYLDDSILAIVWKEKIEGNAVSFAEIKINNSSQMRRKLSGDTFAYQGQAFASELSKMTNAVVSMNADYYMFRDFGVVVYQGKLARFNTQRLSDTICKYNSIDTLYIDNDGDFHFTRRGDEYTEEGIKAFIEDNNINFSIAFGPVLVDNYELQECTYYPVGEVLKGYTRAGLGQMDKLHYLYMVVSHSPEKLALWNINKFAKYFHSKGVQYAYALDGGQTGELLVNHVPYNSIDFGSERLVSDILYFGTSLPKWWYSDEQHTNLSR